MHEGLLPTGRATVQPRLRVHRVFRSRYLPDARDVTVYLPPQYEEHVDRTYPVLYLHDGQNLFDGETALAGSQSWKVREQADAAIESGKVEPLVIVGIHNTGERRVAEYTHEPYGQMGGGEADAYGLLLTRDLMPWIESQYRVRTDRESTGLGGSSLGGLVTLYLGLRHPERFGSLAALSPSVWWNQRSILSYLKKRAPALGERPRLWLNVGDGEGEHSMRDIRQMALELSANGWRAGETLHFEQVRGGTHDEASWAARVRPMLSFLFPARAGTTPFR